MTDMFLLSNIVFQGTVFGPSLWNVCFADVHAPAERNGAKERKFAHDLSISKEFHRSVTNDKILGDLRQSQADIHEWGYHNRVSFDPLEGDIRYPCFCGRRRSALPTAGAYSRREPVYARAHRQIIQEGNAESLCIAAMPTVLFKSGYAVTV